MKLHLTCLSAIALSAIVLGSGLAAQTVRYETSPTGFANPKKPGSTDSASLGTRPGARLHYGDSNHRGTKKTIVSMQFRPRTGYSYGRNNGQGRSWTNLTLTLGDTDVATMVSTFSSNFKASKKEVFSGAIQWSTLTGVQTPKWGGAIPPIQFTAPYAYGGKRDLLTEFRFAGGKLANGASWGAYPRSYNLEGHADVADLNRATTASFPTSTTCNDSAFTHTGGARIDYEAWVYAKDHASTSQQGNMLVFHLSRFTAPNAPVIQAACYGGSAAGVAIGAQCNRLHVDMTAILGMLLRKTDSTGFSGSATGSGKYTVAFDTAWTGINLWYQAAWTDSKTGGIALSRATKVTLPAMPGKATRRMVESSHPNARSGGLVSRRSAHQLLPLFGYR